MIFANFCQRCEQARWQSIKTLLLILLSFGVLSAYSYSDQPAGQVGQAPSDPREVVLKPPHQQTHPNQRVALVIGNGAYLEEPLPNSPNDSEDMATVLKQVGFEVMVLKDASLEAMETAIQQFGEKLKKGGTGFFYFAGHGVQYQGENYLFPIGAMRSVTAAGHLRHRTMNVGYLLATMEGARNNLNVVILDACRNNPFARSLFIGRGVKNPEGLALMEVPTGTLIAYATRPNKTALDGIGGCNSPYVKYLKQELPKPGLSILEVLTNVRVAVKKETKNRQVPWFYSELDRKFCFVEPCGQVVAQTPAVVVQNAPSQPVAAPVSPPAPVLKYDRDRDGVSEPSSYRYSDNGDGTVTDNRTGLIWMKNANCTGRRGMSWINAMRWAAELAHGRCGIRDGSRKGDWRLPTVEEWHAMLDRRYRAQAGGAGRQWNEGPALSNAAGTGQWKEGDAFSGVKTDGMLLQKRYWSSTEEGYNATYFVNIFSGRVALIGQSPSYGVWAVRGGQ